MAWNADTHILETSDTYGAGTFFHCVEMKLEEGGGLDGLDRVYLMRDEQIEAMLDVDCDKNMRVLNDKLQFTGFTALTETYSGHPQTEIWELTDCG